MDFEWRLRAAAGYAELGMNRESMAELNAIEMPSQALPEVLQLPEGFLDPRPGRMVLEVVPESAVSRQLDQARFTFA